eukprot:12227997-Ditylum_brightwellii.AAC.1
MNFAGLGAEDKAQQWDKKQKQNGNAWKSAAINKYDTQLNEGINATVVIAAPTHKTYDKSMSLHNGICIVIGVQLCGEK